MKLAIVAGEASGDLHASEVIHELKQLEPELRMFGIGGDLLAAEGVELLHHAKEMGIVGLVNVIRHLPMFRRVFDELIARIAAERPDVVLLVDYPDFNLRVAKKCRELGLKVVYYISPQLWAWRRGRVKQIAKNVDRMIVIFPFEETFYREQNVSVAYVGHPLVEQLVGIERRTPRSETLRIALMPGSRRMEVASLLPPMLDAVAILRRERSVDAYIIQAPTIAIDELTPFLREKNIDVPIVAHDGGHALADADVALSSSGTATLESAILGTPVVVMYKLSRATYVLARRLVKLPHFSLVNIVAGKRVVPELLQDEVNGPRIAAEVRALVASYDDIRRELAVIRGKLGEPGASRRVAVEIHRMLTR
ncbi:MAG TPA: lipid-A-disaccharide synthase [Thermoanaerobaculia bacterium]|nr:lipid-A-disaccharide synthase [Thermoanaerobaculia bacterium]